MTWKYSNDNPYAWEKEKPEVPPDVPLEEKSNAGMHLRWVMRDCWQQGHDHRDEEVAKLRKVLEIAEDMLAHIECPAHGVSFDSYGATEDLWLRLVENDECTFCATHCNEDGRDSHPWRCWLDLLTAMAEDQEVQDDG